MLFYYLALRILLCNFYCIAEEQRAYRDTGADTLEVRKFQNCIIIMTFHVLFCSVSLFLSLLLLCDRILEWPLIDWILYGGFRVDFDYFYWFRCVFAKNCMELPQFEIHCCLRTAQVKTLRISHVILCFLLSKYLRHWMQLRNIEEMKSGRTFLAQRKFYKLLRYWHIDVRIVVPWGRSSCREPYCC